MNAKIVLKDPAVASPIVTNIKKIVVVEENSVHQIQATLDGVEVENFVLQEKMHYFFQGDNIVTILSNSIAYVDFQIPAKPIQVSDLSV